MHWDEKRLRAWRGSRCAIIFQNPSSALDPLFTVGYQITETLLLHEKISRGEADTRAVELMTSVHLDDPEKLLTRYPHELSGGQLQRVMIAMALACGPDVLIADEPTTALDVTVQSHILALLSELREKYGLAILLISHDLAVAAQICDNMLVMYGGRVCERGLTDDVFSSPSHEYTKALLRCIPPEDGSRLYSIAGAPPERSETASGCAFFPRCENAMHICGLYTPAETEFSGGHRAACWLHCMPR